MVFHCGTNTESLRSQFSANLIETISSKVSEALDRVSAVDKELAHLTGTQAE